MQEQNDGWNILSEFIVRRAKEIGLVRKGEVDQTQLAKRANMRQPSVSRYLNKVNRPGVEQMAKLLQAVDFPLHEILNDERNIKILLALKDLDDADKERILNYIELARKPSSK